MFKLNGFLFEDDYRIVFVDDFAILTKFYLDPLDYNGRWKY